MNSFKKPSLVVTQADLEYLGDNFVQTTLLLHSCRGRRSSLESVPNKFSRLIRSIDQEICELHDEYTIMSYRGCGFLKLTSYSEFHRAIHRLFQKRENAIGNLLNLLKKAGGEAVSEIASKFNHSIVFKQLDMERIEIGEVKRLLKSLPPRKPKSFVSKWINLFNTSK